MLHRKHLAQKHQDCRNNQTPTTQLHQADGTRSKIYSTLLRGRRSARIKMSLPFSWGAGTLTIRTVPMAVADGARLVMAEIIMAQKCAGTEMEILFQLPLRKCRTWKRQLVYNPLPPSNKLCCRAHRNSFFLPMSTLH